MDKNTFINTSEIVNSGNSYRFVIHIFDKNYNTGKFSTSLMSKYNAEKYEQQALELFGFKNWFDIKFGTIFPQITIHTDIDNPKEIVMLECKKGFLLKNEVKPFFKEELQM